MAIKTYDGLHDEIDLTLETKLTILLKINKFFI